MVYKIQPNIFCENCIKCGNRPVIEQTKNGWSLQCSNAACDNSVVNNIIDFDTWNKKNTAPISLKSGPLKKSI